MAGVFDRIELVRGDITKMKVDAIVNAANNSLLGGGGVDGAIHRAAGPQLKEYNRKYLKWCDTGDAKISPGFNLPAKYVIHTVGPVWRGGGHDEDRLLASAYRRSLEVAVENGIKTIAFPNISTGVYGFPKERAADIALRTVIDFLKQHDEIEKVYFVAFDPENYGIYRRKLEELKESREE